MTDVYQRLAEHLDNLPAGYPATETGVELRILKRLFTSEEAEIATGLGMLPEPCAAIAARLGREAQTLAPALEAMSRKGLIFRKSKTASTPTWRPSSWSASGNTTSTTWMQTWSGM